MNINKQGCTRCVILTKNYAIKLPYLYEWKRFLWGLLCNLQEKKFWSTRDERLCPVIFGCSFIVVMPRCQVITDDEYFKIDMKKFFPLPDDYECHHHTENCEMCKKWNVPVERKVNSFGWYKDKIVAIDYGS